MISIVQLGTIDYATGLALQQKLVALRKEEKIADVLLLLEHRPVITLGRNAKAANIVASPALLNQRGVELFECDRGGDVTFHGPGQIVGYPIFDLRGFPNSSPNSNSLSSRAKENGEPAIRSLQSRDLVLAPGRDNREGHDFSRAGGNAGTQPALAAEVGPRKHIGVIDFVRRLEEVLIRTCADFAIPTKRLSGLTGVWTDPNSLSFPSNSPDSLSQSPSPNFPSRAHSTDLLSRADFPSLSSRAEEDDSLQANRSLESRDLGFAEATTRAGPEAKLAAIGVHISRSVTSHGFAINVNTDLSYFNLIIPCGITTKPVTSMQQQLGRPLDLNAVAESISRNFGLVFQSQILWLESLADLYQTVRGADAPAPEALDSA